MVSRFDVRLLAVCLTATNNNSSFDHRVGASKQHWRQFDADRLRHLEVDHQSAEFEITLMVEAVTAKSGKG
jgi:hypothetical protein